jgi:26S proteasome regulatory subunit N5
MAEAAFKPEKDFTKEVDKQIPEAETLAQTNVNAAIEKLSLLEKQTRQVPPPAQHRSRERRH